MQDVGNAAVASGAMEFGDLGNMTKEEIDGLIQMLLELKKQNHFRAFWTTFDESVTLMAVGRSRDRVHVVACRRAAPVERTPDALRRACRWLPRLGRRTRDHVARGRRSDQVPGVSRLHQLVARGRGRCDHDAPGLLQRRPGDEPASSSSPTSGTFWIDGKEAAEPTAGPLRPGNGRDQGRIGSRRRLVRRPCLQLQLVELVLRGERSTRSSAGTNSSPPRLRRRGCRRSRR